MELNQLSRQGLIKLVNSYDDYIKEVCEDEQNDINRYPVCVNEYLNNEFLHQHDKEDVSIKKFDPQELSEFAIDIMDIFESTLDDHNILLPDKNRTGDGEEASIFGETYYNMKDEVKEVILSYLERL